MSTEHQQYSPENQLEVIRQYAAAHGMEIVQAYSDHGRSGLNIAGREGLNRLISDVENKQANFSALLVYDVPSGISNPTSISLASGCNATLPSKGDIELGVHFHSKKELPPLRSENWGTNRGQSR
jgi:hypothetical protein